MKKSLIILEFLFLINVLIINHYRTNYLSEQTNFNVYNQTICQINDIIKEKLNCSIEKKFCEKYSYEISYGDNQFIQINHLPTWFPPFDKENLFQKTVHLKRVNISCYFSQSDIRWSKPNSFRFFSLLFIYLFILLIILIHCFQHFCT